MPEPWEYKVVFFSADRWTRTGLPSDLGEKLDSYGAQGWELVGTEAVIRPNWVGIASTTLGIVAFFKRRRG